MITRETNNFINCNFIEGEIILADKPLGWSSFKVVYEIRKAIGAKKVGHAGTLDPKASGLLILCTGKKTKDITKFQDLEKTYTGTILLGKSSPSMDLETEISEENSVEGITRNDVLKIKDQFLGTIDQIPPMYSAAKFQGKSLYKLARKGKVVDRIAKKVTIYKFEITEFNLPEVHFEIVCSKGTYIRVIADEFGKKLGCGGLLSSLKRTNIGQYSIEDAVSVREFIEKLRTSRSDLIIS